MNDSINSQTFFQKKIKQISTMSPIKSCLLGFLISFFPFLFIFGYLFSPHTYMPKEPDASILFNIFNKEISFVNQNLEQTYAKESLPAMLVQLKKINKLAECKTHINSKDNQIIYAQAQCPVEAIMYSQIANQTNEKFIMYVNLPRNKGEHYSLDHIGNIPLNKDE